MKLSCLLVLFGAVTLSALAQNGGANAGANRGGGISFVTRRLPTSGVGVQAANFFGAGGVPTGTAAAGAGSVSLTAPTVAAAESPQPAVTDAKALAALRQLAARGDKEAQRLLGRGVNPARPARR